MRKISLDVVFGGSMFLVAIIFFMYFIPTQASAHEFELPAYGENAIDENTVFGDTSSEITNAPDTSDAFQGITPRYVPCSMGGRHNMVGNGTGYVWNQNAKKYLLSKGQASRCNKCGMIIISQYNPFAHHSLLGYYAVGSGPVNSVTILYQTSALYYNSKLGNDSFTQSLSWGY